MLCKNVTRNAVVAGNVEIARGLLDRMVGLMFRKNLDAGCAMLITRCAAVHTCFMRFDMDAVFLDKNLQVVRVVPKMRPWRFSPWVHNADSVLELPGGAAAGTLSQGDTLELL